MGFVLQLIIYKNQTKEKGQHEKAKAIQTLINEFKKRDQRISRLFNVIDNYKTRARLFEEQNKLVNTITEILQESEDSYLKEQISEEIRHYQETYANQSSDLGGDEAPRGTQ